MQPLLTPAYVSSGGEVVAALETDAKRGLSPAEVQRRVHQVGTNRLSPEPLKPLWLRFLQQFDNPLLITLLIVGAVKLAMGDPQDALVIISVTVINAVIGTVQEGKAESAIAALADSVRTDVLVLRDGAALQLDSEALVPGDVVQLEAGCKVPADLRLLQVRSLRTDESALTGESVPVEKSTGALQLEAPLAERSCMAYAGSFVTAGQGTGVVVTTGDATEVGQISVALNQAVSLSTPLTRKLVGFSRTLLRLIVLLAIFTFVVGLAKGRDWAEMFDGAVALAVGAIPEELPAIVTIILAIGVHRMAKRSAIIRKLPAVETLGSTTVICSDKTGTLTQNRMTVEHVYAAGILQPLRDLWPMDDAGKGANLALQETLLAGLLCNDAQAGSDDQWVGDPTETALLAAAHSVGMNHRSAHDQHPRRDVLPFESERQYMATLHGSERILLKGSVEAVLQRCSHALDEQGQRCVLNAEAIQAAVSAMAGQGERVLAFAIGLGAQQQRLEHHHLNGDFTFLGLQGMQDPPRPEAIQAVAACRAAGVKVKLITGDHIQTAIAIARLMGIGSPGEVQAMDGSALAALSSGDLAEVVDSVDVFARVAPAQKLQLVEALQANGEVVAMTGDGVNDAPALKQADIGIAMGRSGTEVARQAADMLLTDDNFATIEAAVEEGRGVYLNLRKTLAFVLPVNGGASMTILMAGLLGTPLPVSALQVLWLNMICSLTMSIALAFEPLSPALMNQAPRQPEEPLLNPALIRRVILVSLFNWCVIFGLFFWAQHQLGDLQLARTMAVQGLVLSHLVYLVAISHWRQVWPFRLRDLRQAPAVPLGVMATFALQGLFSQAGWMNAFFGTSPLNGLQLAVCALPMLLMIPVTRCAEWLDPMERRSPATLG